MTKTVIVGAGLGGLFTAIRLLQQGIYRENIFLIDPRSGHYTRPGHLTSMNFELVQYLTEIDTKKHSKANHIKELERIMYNELQRREVTFIKESFVALQAQTENQPQAVITQKNDNSQGVYAADYVFDCTGTHSYVTAAVNQYLQNNQATPAFEAIPLVDINPIPSHLVAHILVDDFNAVHEFSGTEGAQTVPKFIDKKSPQEIIMIREQLQASGWDYNAFPTLYHWPGKPGKGCIYMETPPNLSKEKHNGWIKLLLNIYSEGRITDYKELKPSNKHGEKPRVVGFNSKPHRLNRATFQSSNLPVVIAGFDALKGSDYRLAHGVVSGIRCCELMLRHIIVKNGSIEKINTDTIEQDVFDYIKGGHKNRVETQLSYRQKSIENSYEIFGEIYAAALIHLSSADADKKRHYQLNACTLLYKAATLQFLNLSPDNELSLSKLVALSACLSLYLRTLQHFSDDNTIVRIDDIKVKLRSVFEKLNIALAGFNLDKMDLESRTYIINTLRSTLTCIKEHSEHLDVSVEYHIVKWALNGILQKADALQNQDDKMDLDNELPPFLNSVSVQSNPKLFFSPAAIRCNDVLTNNLNVEENGDKGLQF